MIEIQPEQIQYPFSILDADGNILYRDALVFADAAEFRATSTAERQAMMQERYDNHLAFIEASKQSQEQPTEES